MKKAIKKYDKKGRLVCFFEPSLETTFEYRYVRNERITTITNPKYKSNYKTIIKEFLKNDDYILESKIEYGEIYEIKSTYDENGRIKKIIRKNKKTKTQLVE